MERQSAAGEDSRIGSSRLFAKLADSYRSRGDIEKAITILRTGLEQHPQYLTARIILASCFTDQGELEKALGEYELILREDPFHTAAMKKMAMLLIAMGQPDRAKELTAMYLDEVPGDIEMRRIHTSLDDDQRGITETGEARSEDAGLEPENTSMHSEAVREAGEFEENLGEREEERKQEEPPMARKEEAGGREEEIIATMTLAELYASQGFLEKAIEIYQKVLSREPTNEVAKKRIESMMRGEPRSQAGGEAQPAGEEAAREGNSGIDWERGGAPGEIEVDEEFEKFKKWLTDLTKKKGS